MAKIIKNTTGTDISLSEIGLVIPASSQLEINAEDYILLASETSLTEISPLITAGTLVINDGVNDLPIAEAIDFIKYPDDADRIIFNKNKFKAITAKSGINEAKDFFSVVLVDEEIRVPQTRQLISYNIITNDDTLELEGDLVIID